MVEPRPHVERFRAQVADDALAVWRPNVVVAGAPHDGRTDGVRREGHRLVPAAIQRPHVQNLVHIPRGRGPAVVRVDVRLRRTGLDMAAEVTLCVEHKARRLIGAQQIMAGVYELPVRPATPEKRHRPPLVEQVNAVERPSLELSGGNFTLLDHVPDHGPAAARGLVLKAGQAPVAADGVDDHSRGKRRARLAARQVQQHVGHSAASRGRSAPAQQDLPAAVHEAAKLVILCGPDAALRVLAPGPDAEHPHAGLAIRPAVEDPARPGEERAGRLTVR